MFIISTPPYEWVDEDEKEYQPEMPTHEPHDDDDMERGICEIDGCDFPASECMIPNHPHYCGMHLEEWAMAERVKRCS